MDGLPGLNARPTRLLADEAHAQYILNVHPLRRVLAFTGHTIDDVINCPIARSEVRGYYKLHRQVQRSCEITELERWWNGLA